MKIYKSVLLAAMALNLFACTQGKQMEAGIKLENLDTKAVAGDDFYQFACGGWIANNPISDEYARYGSFDKLREENKEQLRTLIDEIVSTNNQNGTNTQKIADIYKMVIDTARRNVEGIEPIRPIFDRIASINDRNQFFPLMTELNADGIVGGYFLTVIGADMMNSKMNLVTIIQGGLSLPQKEYYFDNDPATIAIREQFKVHVINMFTLFGFDKSIAEQKMESVMKIETRIASKSYNAVKRRNPAENYHKMSYADLKSNFSGIDWDKYFSTMGLEGVEEVDVSQPEPIHEVEAILAEMPLEDQKAYLEWQVINYNATKLTSEIESADFDFYGRVMTGTKEQKPLWKRATDIVSGVMGEAIGQLYVEKHFSPAAKERMEKLVANLQIALGQRIDDQEWMSDDTKARAHEKLNTFYVKIGYPDKWKNYDGLVIDPSKTLFENYVTINRWSWAEERARKFKKPVDNTEWQMTPQDVNAYYNPSTNEICFPAGILQYPFFDMNADDAFNYGAIGVVIGHEMTHGFDDQGRLFDKDGNYKDWWQENDAEKFEGRVKVIEDYFNNIEVLPGLKANGKLTLGENIADHGGLMVAYQAYKNATKGKQQDEISGYTPDQRFFMAYSAIWAAQIRDEEILNRTKNDPHSIGRWRVNGTLPHIDSWYKAFNIQPNNALYIAPEKRAKIW